MASGSGVQVSKASAYAVLSQPPGVAVSKANVYAVLSLETRLNVSKVTVYAVLQTAEVSSARPQFACIT